MSDFWKPIAKRYQNSTFVQYNDKTLVVNALGVAVAEIIPLTTIQRFGNKRPSTGLLDRLNAMPSTQHMKQKVISTEGA